MDTPRVKEIKFRAWDKRTEHSYGPNTPQMRYDVQDTYDCEAGSYFGELVDDPEVILMQYTGFKDRYGNDIYEHDWVTWNTSKYKYPYPVEMKYGSWKVGPAILGDLTGIRVMGNIWENPDPARVSWSISE